MILIQRIITVYRVFFSYTYTRASLDFILFDQVSA